MQDYPKTLPPSARVGFTVSGAISTRSMDLNCNVSYFVLWWPSITRMCSRFSVAEYNFIKRFIISQVMDAWLAYAPVKNNPEDAAKVY